MTYCAGWKYQDSVFLLADTVATKSVSPKASHSSFGQLHAKVRGEYVEESCLKIVPLASGTAAVFAGEYKLARECLDFLRDGLAHGNSIRDLLPSLSRSLGPFSPKRFVELIVATSKESGECNILRWSTANGIDPTKSDFYQIGSLTSYHTALTPAALGMLAKIGVAASRMLPIATAIVQSYGIHDNVIDMNVGGLIFGAQITRGAVTWQQDTNYFLYGPKCAPAAWVTAIARDNLLAVSSTLVNDTRIFGHSTSMPRGILTNQWLNNVTAQLNSAKSSCWIFISTHRKVFTLIFRADVDKDSRYVRLVRRENDMFYFAFTPELMGLLNQYPADSNDGTLPFMLNVRSD